MNVTIQPENILRASWEVARKLPRTRMHTRQDWMSEAYLELRKRIGKAYWSSVNWARATLRRRNFGKIQPEAEADQEAERHLIRIGDLESDREELRDALARSTALLEELTEPMQPLDNTDNLGRRVKVQVRRNKSLSEHKGEQNA